jgi:hypothetical protein
MLAINPHGHLVTTDNTGRDISITGLRFHEDLYRDLCHRYAIDKTKTKINPDELVSYVIARVRL